MKTIDQRLSNLKYNLEMELFHLLVSSPSQPSGWLIIERLYQRWKPASRSVPSHRGLRCVTISEEGWPCCFCNYIPLRRSRFRQDVRHFCLRQWLQCVNYELLRILLWPKFNADMVNNATIRHRCCWTGQEKIRGWFARSELIGSTFDTNKCVHEFFVGKYYTHSYNLCLFPVSKHRLVNLRSWGFQLYFDN